MDEAVNMALLLDHIEGRETVAVPLQNEANQVKFFAIELLLADVEEGPRVPTAYDDDGVVWAGWSTFDVRDHWMRRVPEPAVARKAMKYFFHLAARNMVRTIEESLGSVACAVYAPPYSVVVYGLAGLMPAGRAQKAAEIILESQGWVPYVKNTGSYMHANRYSKEDPESGFPCLEARIFPHRIWEPIEMWSAKKLPLGRDLRSPKDRGFFLDLRYALTELIPRDAVDALALQSQFSGQIPEAQI